jgi:hypothetical protein
VDVRGRGTHIEAVALPAESGGESDGTSKAGFGETHRVLYCEVEPPPVTIMPSHSSQACARIPSSSPRTPSANEVL